MPKGSGFDQTVDESRYVRDSLNYDAHNQFFMPSAVFGSSHGMLCGPVLSKERIEGLVYNSDLRIFEVITYSRIVPFSLEYGLKVSFATRI